MRKIGMATGNHPKYWELIGLIIALLSLIAAVVPIFQGNEDGIEAKEPKRQTVAAGHEGGSQHIEPSDSNAVSYKPINCGVEIIFKKDGSDWEKIQAIGEADLTFGDTTDVRQATKKATLRAKAELAKFMKENLTTEEVSEEITKIVQNISVTQSISGSKARNIIDTTIERISSQSDFILKGVLVLENEVNMQEKRVRVVVGVSRKTQRTADSLKTAFEENVSNSKTATDSGATRRSVNYDNY
jgi:hypothetical protein